MANKTLGTRQKLGFRIEPSQKTSKPRNPVAVAATPVRVSPSKQRAAGPHQKPASGRRQLQKRAIEKILGKPDGT